MKDINERIIDVVYMYSGEIELKDLVQLNRALHIIMSHSEQAIGFISSIEDEFNIEFDDEDVNLDNFLSFTKLVEIVGTLAGI